MDSAPVPRAEPAAPAGRARRAVVVLTLVLAALFGVGAGAFCPAGMEARPPSASQTPDSGAETQEVAETEATAPGRLRSRYRYVRARGARPAPAGGRTVTPVPVTRPRGGVRRCVVMRC
ncbi:hypothetical protein M5362_08480 [Streptomyces sp. Je 1-79]|uniref:hypothetical protein n=1 Tax=Streptomyces sp. Je 1-79 TaxID=2943847 RepID=UPI0021A975B4|nr:hypothetical protein [Streptomyces sp. Je 1-79]MCT4353164.1 hypothetical protein [Streptomyces sp. Je 1-79]